MAAVKLHRAHTALKGIESRNGFLSDETLLHFVNADSFQGTLRKHQNERMRAFRDFYRELDRKLTKIGDLRVRDAEKRKVLLGEWFKTLRSHFGYQNFTTDSISYWEGEGSVPFLRSSGGSHSVAVLFAAEPTIAMDVETGGFILTTEGGERTYEPKKRATLAEQTERILKLSGCSEAILFLTHSAYYFRAESQTSGQYLEIRWPEILLDDNDPALALASHLLSSDFFAYSSNEPELSPEDESADLGDDDTSDGEDSEASAVKAQATASSLLFREDLEQARQITEDLHKQVTLALEILVNERLHIDNDLKRRASTIKDNEVISHQLFKDGLFVLYRILFVLYAEARRFLPSENPQYASFYSVEHLRDWADDFLSKERQGLADPDGTYLWNAFKSIFTLLRRGVRLKGGELVSAFNGQLFAPDQAPLFDDGPALRDLAIARILMTMTHVGGAESGRRLHFANLGIEQLGAVYEALLAQKPIIVREPSVWVPAHGGGVGLVTQKLADALDMALFEEESHTGLKGTRGKKSRKAKGHLSNFIAPERPGFNPEFGRFIIAPMGGQKRQTASFYTPPKLAEFLVKRTLKPLIEGKSSREILNLRIIEAAVGSGGFLIATLRYVGAELLKARSRENDITLRGREPNYQDLQECKRLVLENCLFGVDLNPLSLELCRTSLYLEALVKNQPLPFLHHRLKCGNSLIYADFLNQSLVSWNSGTEFPSIFDVSIDALKVDDKIYQAWDTKEEANGKKASSDKIREKVKVLTKSIKSERDTIGDDEWAIWAIESQNKVHHFLQEARQAVLEFERLQNNSETVDSLDTRHKDRLAWIPDLDPVLIEAEGIEIDPRLEQARRRILQNEKGKTGYSQMVRHQRVFARLKALGDLWCAQWFWPLDKFNNFPTPAIYRELVDYLLDESTLDRQAGKKRPKRASLSPSAFKTLRTALACAREHKFFHWHVEFAQVYADSAHNGFTALISNPPWKVVGVKDKDVYPEYDPQFLATKPALKGKRISTLVDNAVDAADSWYKRTFTASHLAKLWQQALLSPLETSGQVDLSVLFTLAAERILKRSGRVGLLVSRSAVFSNTSTTSLRERFFSVWGLQEAVSFGNIQNIFEIHRQFEFVTILGEIGNRCQAPRFVHGVTDLNLLDSVARNLDARDLSKIQFGHKPIDMPLETVRHLSGTTLSIPGFADPRQAEIARAIHEACGAITHMNDIELLSRAGVHQTSGPRNGLSMFSENVPTNLKTNWADIKAGKHKQWIPLFRGRDYDRFQIFPPDQP